MKTFLFFLFAGVLFKTNAEVEYLPRDVVQSASEIMWYNCENGEGILYAEFEAFQLLKETLTQLVSSEPIGVFDSVDPNAEYSFLYFKVAQPEPRWRVAVLLEDSIAMGGFVFRYAPSAMESWRYHNQKRISNNEAFKELVRNMDDDTLNYCGVAKSAL